jgi:serine phosphatase RsbU (regulator of sigma subunit)
MVHDLPEKPALLEWGIAARMLSGQSVSGDSYLVKPFAGGVLAAVVDGLGHGEEAALAARTALASLEVHAHEEAVVLLERCHEALQPTRGAVLSLASFRSAERTMTWLGVGDVEGVLFRPGPVGSSTRHYLMMPGGVVGYQLPSLRPVQLAIRSGDVLVFATDGIRGGFADRLTLEGSAQEIADRILAGFRRETDDALVLVARYLGTLT